MKSTRQGQGTHLPKHAHNGTQFESGLDLNSGGGEGFESTSTLSPPSGNGTQFELFIPLPCLNLVQITGVQTQGAAVQVDAAFLQGAEGRGVLVVRPGAARPVTPHLLHVVRREPQLFVAAVVSPPPAPGTKDKTVLANSDWCPVSSCTGKT